MANGVLKLCERQAHLARRAISSSRICDAGAASAKIGLFRHVPTDVEPSRQARVASATLNQTEPKSRRMRLAG
jgi:hypothetical protein